MYFAVYFYSGVNNVSLVKEEVFVYPWRNPLGSSKNFILCDGMCVFDVSYY